MSTFLNKQRNSYCSTFSAITLHDLYIPEMTLAEIRYNSKRLSYTEFMTTLQRIEKMLKDSLSVMILQPITSIEGRQTNTILQQLKLTKQKIEDLYIMHTTFASN